MDRGLITLAVVVNSLFIAGGILVVLMAMYQRTKTREMQHRERLALIERGLMPGPEQNPEVFEAWARSNRPPAIATSVGVVIVALGLGLMLLIGIAANEPNAAVGVGGAIVVLGVAFIVNGELRRRSDPPELPPSMSRRYAPPPPIGRSDPPGPIGP